MMKLFDDESDVVRTAELLPILAPRVRLRRLTTGDLRAFQAYRHDPSAGLYQGWEPTSDADASAFLAEMNVARAFAPGEWFQIGIADRDSDTLIGDLGVCVAADELETEIGFTLSPRWQRRGLAAEAVESLLGLLFNDLHVERVVAVADARNSPSLRLLARVGMHHELAHAATFRGAPCIEQHYAIGRNDPRRVSVSTIAGPSS